MDPPGRCDAQDRLPSGWSWNYATVLVLLDVATLLATIVTSMRSAL